MKIIFFNIWHGQFWDGLKKYILKNCVNTDIFCFLEVDPSLQKKLESVLPGFQPIYYRGIKTEYLGEIVEGRSIFVRNGLKIIKKGSLDLFNTASNDAGGSLYAELKINNKKVLIHAIHGKAIPGDKFDTEERLEQSKRIIDFIKNKKDVLKIVGGDFNLMPNTDSIGMFEDAGFRNLIKEYKIKSTRNSISWNQFRGTPGFTKQYFADYIFTSPDVKIEKFEVPYTEVSDHLPLELNFEI